MLSKNVYGTNLASSGVIHNSKPTLVGAYLLSTSKSEEEERYSADKFTNHSDGVASGCGREGTKESAYGAVDRGCSGCFGVHDGGCSR